MLKYRKYSSVAAALTQLAARPDPSTFQTADAKTSHSDSKFRPSRHRLCFALARVRRKSPVAMAHRPDTTPLGTATALPAVGYVNRLPPDSHTALAAAHVRDLCHDDRRQRDEMRQVLNSMKIGFWDWDIPSLEVWYSSYVNDLLGYDENDALWTVNIFRTLIHPDDEAATEIVQNAVLTGETDDYRAEFRVKHKDGRWVWLEATGRPVVRAENGIALRIVGMFTCIDQRKQEEVDAAFITDLRHALLSETDPDAIKRVAIRKLGQHLAADRVCFGRLSGATQALVITEDWRGADVPSLVGEWKPPASEDISFYLAMLSEEIISRDVAHDPLIDAEMSQMLLAARTAALILVPLVVDGKHRGFLAATQSASRNWQDHEIALIRRVAQSTWDSMLRARAQAQAAANKELLELALEMAKLGAREKNLGTGHVRTSPNFYTVIGHPDVTDMTVEEYVSHVHPEDRDRLTDIFLKYRWERGDHIVADEHRFVTADESIRHIRLMAKYYGPSDKLSSCNAYSAVVVQDVTEQRERELAAQRDHFQLLKHSRLSAMGIMASTLAHELNQPLTTAANYLSLVEALALDDPSKVSADMQPHIARALSKVMEAGDIIRRIRSFTNDGSVNATPQPLRDLVYRALSNLFGRAGGDRVVIVNSVPKGVLVQVDALMVENVIVNLVRNAVEALADRPAGAIRITSQRNGAMVLVKITDNGPGMSAEIAADVFSPFVTGKAQGNGLGLPLCRTMVEANGGKIELEEHGPSGTVFCIHLPLAADSLQHG